MLKKKNIVYFLISIIVISGIFYLQFSKGAANIPLDSERARELTGILEEMYAMYDLSLRNGGDVSQFDKILMDSNDYLVEEEAQRIVKLVYGSNASVKVGYLTYMRAIHLAYGKGIEAYQVKKSLALADGRELTEEEWSEIKAAGYGTIPPSNYLAEQTGLPPGPKIIWEKIWIDGDKAYVQFDNGAALKEATFIHANGNWYVVDVRALNVHY